MRDGHEVLKKLDSMIDIREGLAKDFPDKYPEGDWSCYMSRDSILEIRNALYAGIRLLQQQEENAMRADLCNAIKLRNQEREWLPTGTRRQWAWAIAFFTIGSFIGNTLARLWILP